MGRLQRICGVVSMGQNRCFRTLVSLTTVACVTSVITAELSAAGKTSRPVSQVAANKKSNLRTARIASDEKRSTSADHPLTKPLKILRESQKALEGVKDYTATFSKKERVGRGGRKMVSQTMEMKFREKPFSVYFHFQDKATRGREVIYHSGRNDGKLLVHEAGFAAIAGTFSFAPTARDVMKENRHPITEVGMKNMIKKIIDQWKAESKYDETKVTFYNKARLGSVECMAIVSSHPQPRREFKNHMTRVFIEKKTKHVVRVEQYGWPRRGNEEPPLLEEYTYSNVKMNVGLKDIDFDRRNPNYSF